MIDGDMVRPERELGIRKPRGVNGANLRGVVRAGCSKRCYFGSAFMVLLQMSELIIGKVPSWQCASERVWLQHAVVLGSHAMEVLLPSIRSCWCSSNFGHFAKNIIVDEQ